MTSLVASSFMPGFRIMRAMQQTRWHAEGEPVAKIILAQGADVDWPLTYFMGRSCNFLPHSDPQLSRLQQRLLCCDADAQGDDTAK